MSKTILQKWAFIQPHSEERRRRLSSSNSSHDRPAHLTVGHHSQTLGHEVNADVPVDSITFVEHYANSPSPFRLDFFCVGSDLPIESFSPLYSEVTEVHFKGNILSWKMVFRIIASMPKCRSVAFKWGEQETLAMHVGEETVDSLNTEEPEVVEGVRKLQLVLSLPHDNPVLQTALRTQLEIAVSQSSQRYPNLDTLFLDLPDDGRIYDLMKTFVPKWKDLKRWKLGIRDGKIVMEAVKCGPSNGGGSGSRALTQKISTSSSVNPDSNSSPNITVQEKEKEKPKPHHHTNPKVNVGAPVMADIDAGGESSSNSNRTISPQPPRNIHPPRMPGHYAGMINQDQVHPLQIPIPRGNVPVEDGEVSEEEMHKFNAQYTRRNVREEDFFIQQQMMDNRSPREDVRDIELDNVSNASYGYGGQDAPQFRERSFSPTPSEKERMRRHCEERSRDRHRSSYRRGRDYSSNNRGSYRDFRRSPHHHDNNDGPDERVSVRHRLGRREEYSDRNGRGRGWRSPHERGRRGRGGGRGRGRYFNDYERDSNRVRRDMDSINQRD